MSTTMSTITTKQEVKRENWLKTAYRTTPAGECNNVINKIAEKCETSDRTVRRWITHGLVPKEWQLKHIYKILNIDPETKKVKKSK